MFSVSDSLNIFCTENDIPPAALLSWLVSNFAGTLRVKTCDGSFQGQGISEQYPR